VDDLIVASRLIHFTAAALLFGAPLFRLAIAPQQESTGRGWELAASIAALLSGLGWFAGVAATMAGSFADAVAPDILQAVAFDTRFGHLWIGRLIALVAIAGLQLIRKPTRERDFVLAILAAAFAASLVGVGHGMTGAGHGPAVARIHMVADMVHLVCAVAWIGGLFCLGYVLHAVVAGHATIEAARLALRRFSTMGYWAVALIVISGCINAFVMVPRPASLISSDYGRALLLKLALVGVMVAIALVNRLALAPPIMASADRKGVRTLWRSVLVEQGVAILVLAAVARLGTIHPVP
jgi:putative copper resistance protein D